MFLSAEALRFAWLHLRKVHPFFGITYLVCKRAKLPVGKSVTFPINKSEQEFLQEYFKPIVGSTYYFQPFRTSSRSGPWVSHKYPYSGSQSTRTRGDLAQAFIHRKSTQYWGWREKYTTVLKAKLERDGTPHIPVFCIAAWLFRERDWPHDCTPDDIIEHFLSRFRATAKEKRLLFDASVPTDLPSPLFSDAPTRGQDLLTAIGAPRPPDSKPEVGATLIELVLEHLGPAPRLALAPGERLTIITGDNGLGKSFLLDCVWWSLSGEWSETPALPRTNSSDNHPTISFQIRGSSGRTQKRTIKYDWESQSWPFPQGRPTIPGLIVYARVDGSFAVWDPMRPVGGDNPKTAAGAFLLFSRDEVLNGLPGRIEGLLRDWVKWQHNPDQSIFEVFSEVLRRLSPPEMERLVPGPPVRIPGDARDIPTLCHSYGDVPFIAESAGVRRIVTLGYLLVWAWSEHKVYSALAKREPQKRLVILIDEMEAHLHPKWQREILPAVLDVTSILASEIEPQIMVATHSPLVLASAESRFISHTDVLYHLKFGKDLGVKLEQMQFVRFGRVDHWLTSDVFEMKEPRSREAEEAVERAKAVLAKGDASQGEIKELSAVLRRALSADDLFWRRWAYFADRKRGVS